LERARDEDGLWVGSPLDFSLGGLGGVDRADAPRSTAAACARALEFQKRPSLVICNSNNALKGDLHTLASEMGFDRRKTVNSPRPELTIPSIYTKTKKAKPVFPSEHVPPVLLFAPDNPSRQPFWELSRLHGGSINQFHLIVANPIYHQHHNRPSYRPVGAHSRSKRALNPPYRMQIPTHWF
jgi:hypothetical protein